MFEPQGIQCFYGGNYGTTTARIFLPKVTYPNLTNQIDKGTALVIVEQKTLTPYASTSSWSDYFGVTVTDANYSNGNWYRLSNNAWASAASTYLDFTTFNANTRTFVVWVR